MKILKIFFNLYLSILIYIYLFFIFSQALEALYSFVYNSIKKYQKSVLAGFKMLCTPNDPFLYFKYNEL